MLRLERKQREFFDALGWDGYTACEDLVLELDADISGDPNALITAQRDSAGDSFHFRVTGHVALGEWEHHLPADEAAEIYAANGAAGFVIGSIPTGGASSIEFHGLYLGFDDPEGLTPRGRWLTILDWRPVEEPIHIACDGDLEAYNICKAAADIKRDACKRRATRHYETCVNVDASGIAFGSGIAACIARKLAGGGVGWKAVAAYCAAGALAGAIAAFVKCTSQYYRDMEDCDIDWGTDLRLCYLRYCAISAGTEPSNP